MYTQLMWIFSLKSKICLNHTNKSIYVPKLKSILLTISVRPVKIN